MAEIVTEMQERLLPEYEQMKKFEICTDEQIKECIHKRNNFQIKITQNEKNMRHFADFIIYEKKVHKWICEKEKVSHKNLAGLKSKIAHRITRLYRESLKYFPHEERLWQNYINFCKKSLPNEVSNVYEKMLAFHADKPKLWCDAALWIYEYSANMPKVKDMFFRGLQKHATSEALYNAFFGVLLLQASKLSTKRDLQDNTLSEQDVGMEAVEVLYRNSKKKIKNILYYLQLLERCVEKNFIVLTAKLQKTILDDLTEMFPRDERLWHALAQRELHGFNMVDLANIKNEVATEENNNDAENTTEETTINKIFQPRSLSRRIELCCKVYKEAIETLQTTEMWSFYINAMLQLNQDMEINAPLKRKCLAQAFHDGHESGLMSVEHYATYVRMLLETETGAARAKNLLKVAVERRNTLELYELWVTTYIQLEDDEKIDAILCQAKEKLGMLQALPIVQLALDYYNLHSNKYMQKLEQLYNEYCAQILPEYNIFRADYLQFCFDNYTVEKTRLKYNELCKIPPPSLKLHQKMDNLEATAAEKNEKNVNHWRQVHENSTYYFGKTHPQAWIDYLEFEREHGDAKRVSNLHKRAVTTLQPEMVSDFVVTTSLMKTLPN